MQGVIDGELLQEIALSKSSQNTREIANALMKRQGIEVNTSSVVKRLNRMARDGLLRKQKFGNNKPAIWHRITPMTDQGGDVVKVFGVSLPAAPWQREAPL